VSRADAVAGEVVKGLETALDRAARRPWERFFKQGVWKRPLELERDKLVLLFFEDVDQDRWVPGDRHAVRLARNVVHAAGNGQKVTGFEVWFLSLVKALTLAGYAVRVGDEALARENPHYPVGLVGYPHILDHWRLPNPAVLGPGLLDHPLQRPKLAEDRRVFRYIVPCDWMMTLFARHYPSEKLATWFGGIALDAWPDTTSDAKDLDFIIYDKIRWDRPLIEAQLLQPAVELLRARGLSAERLVYRQYNHATFRALLRRARGMLFLCEHETQGMAYQEALASGVPVLAWDRGEWRDSSAQAYGDAPVTVSSVPYFDTRCGERFRDATELPTALERFLSRRAGYAPRAFVAEKLSLAASAEAYLALYRAAAAQGQRSGT
jgi:hypothetical protein